VKTYSETTVLLARAIDPDAFEADPQGPEAAKALEIAERIQLTFDVDPIRPIGGLGILMADESKDIYEIDWRKDPTLHETRAFNRAERLCKLIKLDAPMVILENEVEMIQEAIAGIKHERLN
jgi:hypothetical protein